MRGLFAVLYESDEVNAVLKAIVPHLLTGIRRTLLFAGIVATVHHIARLLQGCQDWPTVSIIQHLQALAHFRSSLPHLEGCNYALFALARLPSDDFHLQLLTAVLSDPLVIGRILALGCASMIYRSPTRCYPW